MVFRFLLRYLINNEQLIQRLSESYPIRRAAQLVVYLYSRGQAIGAEGVSKAAADGGKRLQGFTARFRKELKEGFEEIKKGEPKQ